MSFQVGSLVSARGREWVVLPGSTGKLLLVRPMGGTTLEETGILVELENPSPAQFTLPSTAQLGDWHSCQLLRDALRLGSRNSAGPFRCFSRIAVEPRPYQLVPLLMALKLDPLRLLIADDVGIGKTIEACLIARELLDRGEAQRLAVLCPPHLADQWQKELKEKFNIDAVAVLSSTARRLERKCARGQSIFDIYNYVVVSTEYVKSERRRDDFRRGCPELVIVDEAHTCAFSTGAGSRRKQRYELIKRLAETTARHMIFVTATPHSGKGDVFRSLLSFLDPRFETLPDSLAGKENEQHRRHLAKHLVQRRRADIVDYLGEDTQFPTRQEAERTYSLSPEYSSLFKRVIAYVREIVHDSEDGSRHQRVRWWSALALLRALGSSPRAAAVTLRTRATTSDSVSVAEADELGQRLVLDQEEDDSAEWPDVVPGSDIAELAADEKREQRRLRDLAAAADKLEGAKDEKLLEAAKIIKGLLADGYRPIVFCRFIQTAEYVTEHLKQLLKGKIEIRAVTGTSPPDVRKELIDELAVAHENGTKILLVATDCLSEGINLQDIFNAVMHYDLSWNPTRHEQRDGRVDRFGQLSSTVRIVTYYGTDNQIDGIVLDVLINKHKEIRRDLGISVPVPASTNDVLEAIFEGLLLREAGGHVDQYLPGFEEYFKPTKEQLFSDWDNAREQEKRSRSLFAQHSIKADEVTRELDEARQATGTSDDVQRFIAQALSTSQVSVVTNNTMHLDAKAAEKPLIDALDLHKPVELEFTYPPKDGALYISRSHSLVQNLAGYIQDTALDPLLNGVAARAGVIATRSVHERTTLLLVRNRFHIVTERRGTRQQPQLAEDYRLIAFRGESTDPRWLDESEAETLLEFKPDKNLPEDVCSMHLERIINGFDAVWQHLHEFAKQRGELLLAAHRRVRDSAKMKGMNYSVEPTGRPDVIGLYLYLPALGVD